MGTTSYCRRSSSSESKKTSSRGREEVHWKSGFLECAPSAAGRIRASRRQLRSHHQRTGAIEIIGGDASDGYLEKSSRQHGRQRGRHGRQRGLPQAHPSASPESGSVAQPPEEALHKKNVTLMRCSRTINRAVIPSGRTAR